MKYLLTLFAGGIRVPQK